MVTDWLFLIATMQHLPIANWLAILDFKIQYPRIANRLVMLIAIMQHLPIVNSLASFVCNNCNIFLLLTDLLFLNTTMHILKLPTDWLFLIETMQYPPIANWLIILHCNNEKSSNCPLTGCYWFLNTTSHNCQLTGYFWLQPCSILQWPTVQYPQCPHMHILIKHPNSRIAEKRRWLEREDECRALQQELQPGCFDAGGLASDAGAPCNRYTGNVCCHIKRQWGTELYI